ncbi:MAG: response regulator [Anaerolineae bacterium]|nr:response regulator [Anaerolineae bacterium]
MITPQRILAVEDDHDIADMLSMFLTMHGYEFHHAHNGKTALDITPRILPHAILMDLSLPDMTGYSVMAGLHENPRTSHIPVLFTSKWGSRDKRIIGLALGADDYLTKPFDLKEMLLRVQNSIARAARESFTDLRTGLPAAFTARTALDNARTNPHRAIIEINVANLIPYFEHYGSTASAEVRQMLARLLLDVVNLEGHLSDFVGYLDEDAFVIVTASANAKAITERVTEMFRIKVDKFYPAAAWRNRDRDLAHRPNRDIPRLSLACRVTIGELSPRLMLN